MRSSKFFQVPAILPVFDAIYSSPNLHFILPRHDQGAGHLAEGYARISSKPGVALVTSGLGATNDITAMQHALGDGLPLVVFTGQWLLQHWLRRLLGGRCRWYL